VGGGFTVTNLVVVSSTQITATFVIPSTGTLGTVNITVTTPGGTTNAVAFNVLPPPPSITAVTSPFRIGRNQGVTLQGASLTGANDITAIQLLQNGIAVPAASLGFQAGSFQIGATQLRWSWTLAATLPASSATNVYTMTVTTPSGTSAPFGVTLQ